MIRHHSFSYIVSSDGRVDAVVSAKSGIPRAVFSYASASISINGKAARKSAKVRAGDAVLVEYDEEVFEGLVPEDIPLSVLYEDDDILVIDKQQGLAVHPGAGLHSGTLVNALLYRYGEAFMDTDDERPGIVHRLDKDTSGVMVIARNAAALSSLQRQFAEHSTEKHYAAIAKGRTSSHGMIDCNIERDRADRTRFRATEDRSRGKEALTEYSLVRSLRGYSLLDVRIHTGRTHQIRVHLRHIGHPILGDSIYGGIDPRFPEATLMLHASSLSFSHPRTGERLAFSADLPERFLRASDRFSLS